MRDIMRISNELINMKKNMDRLLESFIKPTKNNIEIHDEENSFIPPVNAIETDDDVKLFVLIPFAKKEDISLNIKDGILTIEGKNCFEVPAKSEILRNEIPSGKFSRSFKIAVNIDPSKVKASYKDGVLQIILPKKEEAKSNKIEIE